jgi:HEAT repeat protein
VRQAVAEALGKIGDVQAVPYLIQALKDRNWNVREAAARSLSQIRNARAIPYLIRAVKTNDEYVSKTTSYALRQINDVQAIPYLIQALQDDHEIIRKVAARNLLRIGEAQAVPQLIPVLNHGNWMVRQIAADVLGQLAPMVTERKVLRRAARTLWWRLTDHPGVAKAAFHALDQVANRLSVLEVETRPVKDLLHPAQSRKDRKENIKK